MSDINRYHLHMQLKSRLQRLGLLSVLLLAISGCASSKPPSSPFPYLQPNEYMIKGDMATCDYYADSNDHAGCEPKLNDALTYFNKSIELYFSIAYSLAKENPAEKAPLNSLSRVLGRRAKVKQKLNDPRGAFADYAGAIKALKLDREGAGRGYRAGTAETIGQWYQQQAMCKRQLNDPQGAQEAEDSARTFFDESVRLKEEQVRMAPIEAEQAARYKERWLKEQQAISKERDAWAKAEEENRRAKAKADRAYQAELDRQSNASGYWEQSARKSAEQLKAAQSRDNARREADYRIQNNCSGSLCNNR